MASKRKHTPNKTGRHSRTGHEMNFPKVGPQWFLHFTTHDELILLRVAKRVGAGRTALQGWEIIDTVDHGRCLILDGRLQSAEQDEAVYHESLVQPVLCHAPRCERVAIIGGAEGATLREVLRFTDVARVVMVDIDGELVDLCRKYLAAWSGGAFDNPRASVIIGDGIAWLEAQPRGSQDIIIVDVTECRESSAAIKLYSREFYTMCRDRLADGGGIAVHCGTGRIGGRILPMIVKTFGSVFPSHRPGLSFMAAFCEPWGFMYATKGDAPCAGFIRRPAGKNKFYDEATDVHMHALPLYIREAIAGEAGAITNDSDLTSYKY